MITSAKKSGKKPGPKDKTRVQRAVTGADLLMRGRPALAAAGAFRGGSAEERAAVNDISTFLPGGEMPAPADPKRRARAMKSLTAFGAEYGRGFRPNGPVHVALIKHLTDVIERNATDLLVMTARRVGKSEWTLLAIWWAMLSARSRFAVFLSVDAKASRRDWQKLLRLMTPGSPLALDFPEVSAALLHVGSLKQAALHQTWKGRQTNFTLTGNSMVFPEIPGSGVSGSRIDFYSVTAFPNGLTHIYRDAEGVEHGISPDLAILDDPLKVKDGKSLKRVDAVEDSYVYGVGGSGGHSDTPMARITLATPMTEVDFCARLQDKDRHPTTKVFKVPFLESLSSREDLWLGSYADLRAKDRKKATAFYRKNRREMDSGVVENAPHAYNADTQISSTQRFYDQMIDKGKAFVDREYQMVADILPERASGIGASDVLALPSSALDDSLPVVAMIDVQHKWLYWTALQTDPCGLVRVVGIGRYPDYHPLQIPLVSLSSARGMDQLYDRPERKDVQYAGLCDLVEWLTRGKAIDGAGRLYAEAPEFRARLVGADAAGSASDAVYDASEVNDSLIAVHGRGIGPNAVPMRSWPDPKRGYGEMDDDTATWRYEKPRRKQQTVLWLVTDKYALKTRVSSLVASRSLHVPPHGPPGMMISLANHLSAESVVEERGHSNTAAVWRPIPGIGRENHFFDCLYNGLAVAALDRELHGGYPDRSPAPVNSIAAPASTTANLVMSADDFRAQWGGRR